MRLIPIDEERYLREFERQLAPIAKEMLEPPLFDEAHELFYQLAELFDLNVMVNVQITFPNHHVRAEIHVAPVGDQYTRIEIYDWHDRGTDEHAPLPRQVSAPRYLRRLTIGSLEVKPKRRDPEGRMWFLEEGYVHPGHPAKKFAETWRDELVDHLRHNEVAGVKWRVMKTEIEYPPVDLL